MWFEEEMERAALHAYHNEPWTEEDYETMKIAVPSEADDGLGGIQMTSLRRWRNNRSEYEGGHDDGGGFMATVCCWKKQNHSEKKNEEGSAKFDSMSPDQKKAHIDMLWNKARRYNNKLRF